MNAAEAALINGDLVVAEKLCRDALAHDPRDVTAMRLLGEVGMALDRLEDANLLLTHCLEIAPGCDEARCSFAELLVRMLRFDDASAELDRVLGKAPNNVRALSLQGTLLAHTGSEAAAVEVFDRLFDIAPANAGPHLQKAHLLKTAGRQAEAILEYRKAMALQPDLGEIWWSLSNLKTYRFSDDELERMLELDSSDAIRGQDRLHLSFALGKALEDRGEYEASFSYYAAGNSIRAESARWNATGNRKAMRNVASFFTQALFDRFEGAGNPSPAPIFVVGLPRSGSTLLEQVLASHSQVEGTMELPDIMSIAEALNGRSVGGQVAGYPAALEHLGLDELVSLGTRYLAQTAAYRRGATRFIDKMPNNFAFVGLIHLILPNAVILDARRHPMACGFGIFKQLFAYGQRYSYSLEDIGCFYRDYIRLMSHWDEVLPGRVLKVDYESMITDTESTVRRVLAHCKLEFEPACLEFYRTERAVHTPSSEQVRQPIYRDALEHWRNYEPFLEPLARSLRGGD